MFGFSVRFWINIVFFRCFQRAIEITSVIGIILGETRCLFHLEEIAIQIGVGEFNLNTHFTQQMG